jgi:glutaredoxin
LLRSLRSLRADRAWQAAFFAAAPACFGAVARRGCRVIAINLIGRGSRRSLGGRIARVVKDGGVVEFAERVERVVVLTRQGCHLCDVALAQVAAVCAETGERYAVVDVDGDPELLRRYTDQVPVTFVDGAQHDFWRVDPARLKAALLRSR